jgi:hypothetical protein
MRASAITLGELAGMTGSCSVSSSLTVSQPHRM